MQTTMKTKMRTRKTKMTVINKRQKMAKVEEQMTMSTSEGNCGKKIVSKPMQVGE